MTVSGRSNARTKRSLPDHNITATYELELPVPDDVISAQVTPQANDTMTFHRVSKQANASVLLIGLESANETLLYKLFVREGDRYPAENESDWQTTLRSGHEVALLGPRVGDHVIGIKQCEWMVLLIFRN